MRLVPLLATAVLLSGCGGDGAPTPVTTPATGPPPFELRSEAGTQRATQGSSCVDGPSGGGMFGAVCIDTGAPRPERLSVVRPGETIAISMPGARLAGAEASVHPLGCPGRLLHRVPLRPGETRWPVGLPSGDYELSLFGRFAAGDGRRGDSSAVAGLRVSRTDDLELVDAGDRAPASCR